jgi:cytochrome c oxidase subunit 2/cytochrome aa3-600 menaquinol oxidase subunit 2
MGSTVLTLNGCVGALSTVDPAGPAARTIATLWWVMLTGAIMIFALVVILVAASFRKRKGAIADRFWVLILGIAFPVTVLLALLGYGLFVGERLLQRQGADVVRVAAEGRQWDWQFSYDDLPGQTTAGVLHIPAGQPVDVAITSADVVHSFWVPRLAGKMDAIPGRVNVLRIEADTPGTFRGLSSEFSGRGYDNFTFDVVAHDAADWTLFLQGETE